MTNDKCETCDGTGEMHIECTCYEIIGGGHQMGCPFYGMKSNEIQEMASKPIQCLDCKPGIFGRPIKFND